MEKIEASTILKDAKLISNSMISNVYLTKDLEIIKIFNENVKKIAKLNKLNLEGKILEGKKFCKNSTAIIKPNGALYSGTGEFMGYKTTLAKGNDFNNFIDNMPNRLDLELYTFLIHNIEIEVAKAGLVVFPDLLTVDNIFVDDNLNISFIDFDGLQFGRYFSLVCSTSLGDTRRFESKQYKISDKLFTKEIDKVSILILYFLTIFNVDLTKIGKINPLTNRPISATEIFHLIGLENEILFRKIVNIFGAYTDYEKSIYTKNRKNSYLGDEIFEIAKRYDLANNRGIRKLIKK